MAADAQASFEAKWMSAQPELVLALRFAEASMRPFISAFACLSNEIAHAAFHIVEPAVAATKLHWWAEELSGFAAGRTRHPLTEVLAGYAPMRALGPGSWEAIVPAAFAQREAGPFSTLGDMLDAYRRFQAGLAGIEAALHPKLAIETSVKAASLLCAFDESVRLAEMLARDRLPIPLDLLARHQLSRSDIGQSGAQRGSVLREHFLALGTRMSGVERFGLSPLSAIRLQADQKRCLRAAKAAEPLAESARNLDRLPLASVWTGWRAARRMRASG